MKAARGYKKTISMTARIFIFVPALILAFALAPGGAARAVEDPPVAIQQAEKSEQTPFATGTPQTEIQPEKQAAAAAAPPPAEKAPPEKKEPSDEEKRKRLNELIKIKGYWYTRFRDYSASGNEYRFESSTGLAAAGNKVEQGTDLSVLFQLSKHLSLDGSVYDMPRQERQMKFGVTSGHLHGTMGDFTATLKGGAFANFSKKITGAMFEYNTNRTSIVFLTSEPKSVTKTESFRGRNIKGPYDLKGQDLIPERVIIRKNGETLSSDQYIIEPRQGDITFTEIITPNDLITVTYEQTFQVSIDTGRITGIGAGRKSKSGKWSWQAAQLRQEAARSVTTGIESVTGETPTLSGPNAAGQYILKLAEIGETNGDRQLLVRFGNDPFNTTESITKNGAPLTYPNDYNTPAADTDTATTLARGTDLEFRTEGKFALKDPPQAGDVFTVSYSYYPASSINCYPEEMMPVDVDGTTHFAHRTVYYGTEVIVGCQSDDPLDCANVPLKRHDTINGYEISETTNTIYLRGAAAQYLFIKAQNYCTYPAFLPTGSIYDKSVTSFTADYTPSAALKLQLDYAVSESDVAAKPIYVYSSVPATFATATACPSAVVPDPCAVRLGDTDITPETERIFFNDVTAIGNMKRKYTDYNIDYDTGTLSFVTDIPAGTVVIADYSRQPPKLGIREGRILRLASAYTKPRLKLNLTTQRADTFFTGIGGENNLEVENNQLNGEYSLTDSLKMRFDLFKQLTALDTLGANHQSNNRSRYEIQYGSRRIKNFRFFTLKRTVGDDYAVSRIDSSETSNGFSIAIPAPFIKNLGLDYDYKKDSRSNGSTVNNVPDSDSIERNLGLAYTLGKLGVNAKFGNNTRNSTDYTGAPYSITTDTRNLNLRYDFNIFRMAANLNRQQTSDSQPGSEASSIESSTISIETRPFWRVTSFRVNHSRQDRPAVNTPSTSSTSTSYTAPIRISPALQMTTSYVVTHSSVGDSSSSGSTSSNYSLEYRPPGRPYHVIYSVQKSNSNSSSSAGSSSRTSSARNQINAAWTPGKTWAHTASFQTETTQTGAGGAYKSSTLTYGSRFKPSDRKNYFFQYNLTRRAGYLSEQNTTYNFGTDYVISKLISWKLSWKRSKYDNARSPRESFTGDLMETELRATF